MLVQNVLNTTSSYMIIIQSMKPSFYTITNRIRVYDENDIVLNSYQNENISGYIYKIIKIQNKYYRLTVFYTKL